MDPDGESIGLLRRSILAFFKRVEATVAERPVQMRDLQYPASDTSAIRGSEVGKLLWCSSEGRNLIRVGRNLALNDRNSVMSDARPQGLYNLFASLHASGILSQQPFGDYLETALPGIVDLLASPRIEVTVVTVLHGLDFELDEALEVESGILLTAFDSQPFVVAMMDQLGVDSIQVPNLPRAVVLTKTSASTDEFGLATAPLAAAYARTLAMKVQDALFFCTGAMPVAGSSIWAETDIWLGKRPFGFAPPEVLSPSGSDIFREAPIASCSLDRHNVASLADFMRDRDSVFGDDANEWIQALGRLPEALRLMSVASRLFDPRARVLLATSALESVLLGDRTENSSRLGPRAAHLVGRSIEERRRLRRSVQAQYDLRSAIAHGDSLDIRALHILAGDDPPVLSFDPESSALEAASRRCLETGRRAIYAAMNRILEGQLTDVGRWSQESMILKLEALAGGQDDPDWTASIPPCASDMLVSVRAASGPQIPSAG
jgi:hypothetical protein